MRTISLLIIHCSATKEGKDFTAEDIDHWHRERGYSGGIGYHYVIRLDGTLECGRPEEVVGAHCKNHNAHSIGICYIGGLDSQGKPADTRTDAQKATLRTLLASLKTRYPRALILGHHHLNPEKACPCYDPTKE